MGFRDFCLRNLGTRWTDKPTAETATRKFGAVIHNDDLLGAGPALGTGARFVWQQVGRAASVHACGVVLAGQRLCGCLGAFALVHVV